MIIVFYLKAGQPGCCAFEDHGLAEALQRCEVLRANGYNHVCISTELADHVGKAGVDSVADGMTPDGHKYDWSKSHRGAGPRRQ